MIGSICITLAFIQFTSSMPMPPGKHGQDMQAQLSSDAEDFLPTPFKERKDLGNGVQEITLKAIAPLPIAAHGTADGLKGSFETTFMVCQEFDISALEAMHITKFEPLISKQRNAPGDGTTVHHIDIFLCDGEAPGLFNRRGGRCDSFPDEDRTVGTFPKIERQDVSCREFAYAYDRGAGAVEFPKDYGVRIGKGTPWKYMVMQRHLLVDPKMKATFMEDSGVKLTLTKHLRKHNLGISGILDYSLNIPGGRKSFDYTFTCPAEKVTKMFSPDSDISHIRPIALHLHMHNRGKKMRFELIRNGKVVSVIGQDMKYGGYGPSENFHILPMKGDSFTDEQLIHKGDALRVTCTYNTENKTAPTRYGIDWHDEMCGPLFYYSPHDPNKKRPHAYDCEGDFGNEATN
jgi:hypothetical protein